MSSASSACSGISADSGYYSSADSGLPKSSYDGSHLPWKTFRAQILVPHKIRILDHAPNGRLPQDLKAMISAASQHAARFEMQMTAFRQQVLTDRGLGSSALFSPNLLPTLDDETKLARHFIPSFDREPLPQRAPSLRRPSYELSVPRPCLSSGFSQDAFSDEEIQVMPSYMGPVGTTIDYDTGYVSTSAVVYSPYFHLEPLHGSSESSIETANNRCAIDGAWSARSLQMLFAADSVLQSTPVPPSFSCVINKSLAIINLHWVDGQDFCMTSLCKFDLTSDEHFVQFLIFVEAVDRWAVQHVLPKVKSALQRMAAEDAKKRSTRNHQFLAGLSAASGHSGADNKPLLSLKLNFDDIPWRDVNLGRTPVSSSTASKGSPMISDLLSPKDCTPVSSSTASKGSPATSSFPATPLEQSVSQRGLPTNLKSDAARQRMSGYDDGPLKTPPGPSHNDVLQRRLDLAMAEIQALSANVKELSALLKETNQFARTEVEELKTTISFLLGRDTRTSHGGLPIRSSKDALPQLAGLGLMVIEDDPPPIKRASAPVKRASAPAPTLSREPIHATDDTVNRADSPVPVDALPTRRSPRPASLQLRHSNLSSPLEWPPAPLFPQERPPELRSPTPRFLVCPPAPRLGSQSTPTPRTARLTIPEPFAPQLHNVSLDEEMDESQEETPIASLGGMGMQVMMMTTEPRSADGERGQQGQQAEDVAMRFVEHLNGTGNGGGDDGKLYPSEVEFGTAQHAMVG
ncbi:uncharacterized protein HMPREF1541_08832 [Cyphellophora europaea CBS 101466]|uniref:DUF7924 domain-containing protein n=1 Tax=Cyphellophora europaea (strain CBS 101466) TaxID=1220924 RepID=W2RLE7_CYPE1|nr:uncharacterized protein HMPREF1541_08832 [Cyphellophora europaea CBS 101466]ETN36554.1 hypothetical protein HMPREF1541_08832 [Cyphellophora europaea CBS 101466]